MDTNIKGRIFSEVYVDFIDVGTGRTLCVFDTIQRKKLYKGGYLALNKFSKANHELVDTFKDSPCSHMHIFRNEIHIFVEGTI